MPLRVFMDKLFLISYSTKMTGKRGTGWNNPERERLSPVLQMRKVRRKVKGSSKIAQHMSAGEPRLESGLTVKAALTSECGWGQWGAIAPRSGTVSRALRREICPRFSPDTSSWLGPSLSCLKLLLFLFLIANWSKSISPSHPVPLASAPPLCTLALGSRKNPRPEL